MRSFLFLFLFSFTTFIGYSQAVVEKSTDVVVVLGRKYYVHTVKQGETIYSISRCYNVPQQDVLLINKEVVNDLKAGSALRIPVIDDDYVAPPIKKISFVEHTVERKESLYSISQQHGVSQDDIIKYNPQIENGIEKGMMLKIPVIEQEEIVAKDEFFTYHQVQKGDNLQIIALQYGVTVEKIIDFNPKAKEMQVGDILAIPTKTLSEDQKKILEYNQSLTPDFFDLDLNYFIDSNYPPCHSFVYEKDMTFKIAFVLPFFLNENYSLSYDAVSKPDNAHFYHNTKNFFDYFQGALLAVDKVRKEGMNLEVFVYDSRGDSNNISSIFNKYEMSKMDLIFGPIFPENFDVVRKFAEEYKINVIAPLSNKIEIIEKNPFVFKVVPSLENILKYTARHVAVMADTCFVSIVNNGTAQQIALADSFKNNLIFYNQNLDSLEIKDITFSKFITPYQNLSLIHISEPTRPY